MGQELEIEFKNLLTEKEYTQLMDAFEIKEEETFTQENIYFDTEDFHLKQHLSALRIRLKENQAEMTLKTPSGNHLLETNVSLSLEEANSMIQAKQATLPEEVKKQLQVCGLNPSQEFRLITHLKTKRAEKQVKKGLIVLDQSWYAAQTDFELEVEVSDEIQGERWFHQLLDTYSIPKRETKNKIQRAYAALSTEK